MNIIYEDFNCITQMFYLIITQNDGHTSIDMTTVVSRASPSRKAEGLDTLRRMSCASRM